MDIGTPERYLQGTFDILEGTVWTEVRARLGYGLRLRRGGVENAGRIVPSALVEPGCRIARGADRRPRGARAGVSVGRTRRSSGPWCSGQQIGSELHAQRLHRRRGCGSATAARRGAQRPRRGRPLGEGNTSPTARGSSRA